MSGWAYILRMVINMGIGFRVLGYFERQRITWIGQRKSHAFWVWKSGHLSSLKVEPRRLVPKA